MKNKFEALKAFIDWPADWQRLCLLVFAEGYNEPEAGQLTQAEPVRDCIDQGEMKLEPMPVRRAAKPKRKINKWSIAQQEHLVECMNQCGSQKHAAEMFLKRYPGREPGAVKIKIYNMTDANGVMHVRY